MMPSEEVQAMLDSAFPDSDIHLSSRNGDNHHFELVIISGQFEGKSMVQQHQLVYKALGDAMKEAIHALALNTYTPEQWKKSQGG